MEFVKKLKIVKDMVYSCAYPININFMATDQSGAPIDYTDVKVDYEIWREEQGAMWLVHSGTLFGGNTEPPAIDVSNIVADYLSHAYESSAWGSPMQDVPGSGAEATIAKFIVRSVYLDGVVEFTAIYNYNTDYLSQYPDAMCLADPISTEVDPRQYLTLSSYNVDGDDTVEITWGAGRHVLKFADHILKFGDDVLTVGSPDIGSSVKSSVYHFIAEKLSDYDVAPGDKIAVSNNGVVLNFNVVTPCHSRFVIYYVNKLGGLDSLLCNGKATESWNPTHENIRVYDNRLDRRDFQAKRVMSEIEKRYELNSPILTDEGAAKIDNLIYSPKVWVHDLDKDTVTACLISDTSYTVKSFRNDRKVQYTINLYESQKYLRK